MKMIYKFKDGRQVAVSDLASVAGEGDTLHYLMKIKETDGPIEINLDNGEKLMSSGKELIAVEIVLE